jgi:uncharacterized repeat protein (TIGR02543 family)
MKMNKTGLAAVIIGLVIGWALILTGCPDKPRYTVIFDLNGGNGQTPDAQTVNDGESIILPSGSGLTKNSYAFNGWNINADGTGTNYDSNSSYTVTGDVTLYARWAAEGTINYIITFNVNGGSGTIPNQQSVLNGSSVTLPSGSGLTKPGYIFSGWNTNADGTGTNYNAEESFTPAENTTLYAKWNTVITLENVTTGLAEKLAWLKTNAQSNTSYILEVYADESIPPQDLSYEGDYITITLRSVGTSHTISLSSKGTMFKVGDSVTLILDNNITLRGRSDNHSSLVVVNGRLIMNSGSFIIGNTGSYNNTYYGNTHGGGVYIGSNGAFTMTGGEISDNTAANGDGGGVYVDGGIFTMKDGKIASNTVGFTLVSDGSRGSCNGGGVFLNSGTFTMEGGEISGNTHVDDDGGGCGVYINWDGSFTMTGGEITGNHGSGVIVYGNTASFTMQGDASISGNISGGGGVYVQQGTFIMRENASVSENTGGGVLVSWGTFTMNGGKISGHTYSGYVNGGGVYVFSGTFTMNGGEISGNTASGWNSKGGGVYIEGHYEYGVTFTKTGGTIYGYDANDTVNSNVARNDTGLNSNSGHAVFAHGNDDFEKRKETTAGPGVNLHFNSVNNTFSGEWDDDTYYTITFNSNNGSGTAPLAQTTSSGSSITLPSGSELTRAGYIFGGWNTSTDGTGTNYDAGTSYSVTNDVILYAVWQQINVPNNLSASAASSSSITVTWDEISNADEYYVYRSSSASGTYTRVGTTLTASYTDTGLSENTTCYYKVSAYYSNLGESLQSSYTSAKIPPTSIPSVPTGISASATSSSSIMVRWTAVSNADGYYIYRSSSASGTYTRVGTSSTASYSNNGLSMSTTYYYKVSAYNDLGESSQSSYVSETTPFSTGFSGTYYKYSNGAYDYSTYITFYDDGSYTHTIPSFNSPPSRYEIEGKNIYLYFIGTTLRQGFDIINESTLDLYGTRYRK